MESTDSVTLVEIPSRLVAKFIGKRESTIRWFREESGASIKVVDKKGDTQQEAQLKISGPKESQQKAVNCINLWLENTRNKEKEAMSLTFSSKHRGTIIGRQGANLQRMESETRTKINIRNGLSPEEIVVEINGIPRSQNKVKALITSLIDAQQVLRVHIPTASVDLLFGDKKSIWDKNGAHVKVTSKKDGDNTELEVKGSKEARDLALKFLKTSSVEFTVIEPKLDVPII